MSIADAYASLACMFDYPAEKEALRQARSVVGDFLAEQKPDSPMVSCADFITASPLAALQEEYVATFDFNPATAPYLGHHLFGDNQKKAGYMIRLKQEYGEHGYVPATNELPDHISLVLGFMAHLAREEDPGIRRKFLEENVLPGLEKLSDVFAGRPGSHWGPLVEAARFLCSSDCKEVTPC